MICPKCNGKGFVDNPRFYSYKTGCNDAYVHGIEPTKKCKECNGKGFIIGNIKADLQVKIAERDVPDFYRMLRDFRRERGNTFGYMEKELEKMYPKLKKQYEDNDNGLNG